MRKLGMIVALAFVMASCGSSKDAEETVDLKTFKDKLSYVLGAQQSKFIMDSGDPNLEKLNFDEILAGFDTGMKEKRKELDQGCQSVLRNMYGVNGQDFDSSLVKSGSNCIGKIAGTIFYQTWTKKGVMDQIDPAIARIGFMHGLNKKDTLVDATTSMKMMTDFLTSINKKSGAAMMTAAKKLPNTREIEGGIIIETLQEGTGASPSATDDVEVNYILTNADGDTVENSFMIMEKTGQPAPAFNLTGVIQGWGVSFPNLKKGGKYNLYIPWQMAYGEQNQCETLKFFVELKNFGPQGTLAKPQGMPAQQ